MIEMELHEQICHRQDSAAFLVQPVVAAAWLFPQGADAYVADVNACTEVNATPQFIVEDQVARCRPYLPAVFVHEGGILLLHPRVPGQVQTAPDVRPDALVVAERIARAETNTMMAIMVLIIVFLNLMSFFTFYIVFKLW